MVLRAIKADKQAKRGLLGSEILSDINIQDYRETTSLFELKIKGKLRKLKANTYVQLRPDSIDNIYVELNVSAVAYMATLRINKRIAFLP